MTVKTDPMLSPEQLLNKDLPQQTGENEFIPFYDILSRKDGSRTIKKVKADLIK